MRAIEEKGPFYTPQGELATDLGPYEGAPRIADESFKTSGRSWLPPDGAVLEPSEILEYAMRDCSYEEVQCIDMMLDGPITGHVVPPALQANFLRAFAESEGLESLGQVTDRLGRTAEVFGFDAIREPIRELLLFSTETGLYLGQEDVLVGQYPNVNQPFPSLWSATLLVESRMVTRDEMPELTSHHTAYDADE
jgi:hypothetical protein